MKPNPYESPVGNDSSFGKYRTVAAPLFFAAVLVYVVAAVLLFAVDVFRFEYGSSVTECPIPTQGCLLVITIGFLGATLFGASAMWGLAKRKTWGRLVLFALFYVVFVFVAYSQVSSSFSSGMLTL